jgi:hypothetical protein
MGRACSVNRIKRNKHGYRWESQGERDNKDVSGLIILR